MQKILVVGSSGHAKVVVDIIENENKYSIAGLLDPARHPGETLFGYKILGTENDLPKLIAEHDIHGIIVAIGDNYVRATVANRIIKMHPLLEIVSAVHPSAVIGKDVLIGQGSVVVAGAVVNASCKIGRFCILNTNSSIDHDSVLADFASMAPRVATGGKCTIGAFSAIGIGAILIHGISIGDHVVVGAGAIVMRSIDSFQVAYGSPARLIRTRAAGEKYL